MIESTVFIGAVIVGITQFIKLVRDKNYAGALVIVFAVLVGLVVSLVDTQIGIANISVAQGVLLGLASSGAITTAQKIG